MLIVDLIPPRMLNTPVSALSDPSFATCAPSVPLLVNNLTPLESTAAIPEPLTWILPEFAMTMSTLFIVILDVKVVA